MNLTEKAAYIRGLMEGMDLDRDAKETKILTAIVDLLDDMSLTVCDLEDSQAELEDYVEELDEDLGSVEEELYGDDCDCDCCDDEDDGFHYKTECPNCGEELLIDMDIIKDGQFECPNCGEVIDFSDDEEDGCDCSCCDHDHDKD